MSNFVVTEKAMRPASDKRQCFYCYQPIGAMHQDDCVLVKKNVIINFSINLEVDVPAHWDADQIEFHRNQSSSCASNVLDELVELEKKSGCLCGLAEFSFVTETSKPYLHER
jgi:hypothetical protein